MLSKYKRLFGISVRSPSMLLTCKLHEGPLSPKSPELLGLLIFTQSQKAVVSKIYDGFCEVDKKTP